MKRTAFATVLATAILLSPSCSRLPVETAGEPAALQKSAKFLYSTDELAEAIGKGEVIVIHTTRGSYEDYENGHIPGARYLHLRDFATSDTGLMNEMPSVEALTETFTALGIGNEKQIVAYDDEAGIIAARLFVTLDYAGHGHRVALLDGQLAKWMAEDRGLSKLAPNWQPAAFTAKPRPEILAKVGEVQAISMGFGEGLLVDARDEAEFQGRKETEGVPRAGHIPNACNISSGSNLQADGLPVFRSIEELQALYPDGQPLVVYCRSGVQASQAYFTARMLGRDVRLYDGSFNEWSNNKLLPVSTEETPAMTPVD
jgi:thiosulfate/3-mercaptopyruvate sulfurtransferase